MNSSFLHFFDSILKAASRVLPSRLMIHWLWLLRKNPTISDAWGFHIRPIHYYEPLPDFRTITPFTCERRRIPPAIEFDLPAQVSLLKTLASESRVELDAISRDSLFDFMNTFFTGADACVYYALIRHLKPRRIVEVGSGYSTRIASLAVARNEAEGNPGEIICIEPYPEPRLTKSNARFTLVEKSVQEIPLSFFEYLSKNDILLIDSSHVATIGSDVCYEFLDIFPRLKPEVWVHVHDIFFPRDYPPAWVTGERRAYNEQYLLEAFLSGNRAFIPKLCNHWLALEHGAAIDALCPPSATSGVAFERLGGSFWMCRTN